MAVFATVVDVRSFSAAARLLGLTKSAVSKQVSRLEAAMGAQLLRRTTRSFGLTEAGRALHGSASQALSMCRDAEGVLSELTDEARGLLRITAPVTWGRTCLAPLLPGFLAANPQVQVQLVLLDRPVDLAEEAYDLAIRLTRELPEGMVARRLAPIDYVLCTSAQAPLKLRAPSELAATPCLRYGEGDALGPWRFRSVGGRVQQVKVQGPLMVNSSEALRDAVRAGLGVALLPRYLVKEMLRARELRVLLPAWTPLAPIVSEPHILWLRDRHQPPKTRVFLDHVLAHLGP